MITGATGFIGNHVVQQLLDSGYRNEYKIIATSRNEQKAAASAWFHKVKYIPFDLKQFDIEKNYYKFFDEPDVMIHLAWEGLPNYKSLFHFEENLPRHYAFVKNMIQYGLTDLSVTGTCFEYGMQEGSLREDMCALPANPYALAKDTLRKFLQELQKVQTYVLKWIRLFYMYGEGQNPSSLFSQLDKALANQEEAFNMSGGEQVRDFLPIGEVASTIISIAMQQKINGIINCGSGDPLTIKQLIEQYLQRKNKNIKLNLGYYPYTDYEPTEFWADTSKLRAIINASE